MDTQATSDLQIIYAPIQTEMRQLGDFLAREFSSPEPFIFGILNHVSKFCGKQIRPALLFLAGRIGPQGAAEGTRELGHDHVQIGAVIELIHTATLVHDDLLDDARLRRSVETIQRRWGERAAVLIGDFIYSRAFNLSTAIDGMAKLLSDTTHTICEGELLQLEQRFRPDLDEALYFKIIAKKTAILHAVAAEVGGRLSGLPERLCRKLHAFGMDLGMAFQVVDDCLDYTGKESKAGKSLGTDLHQNKVTLPLIYLLESLAPGDAEWLKTVLREPLSRADELRIQDMLGKQGSVGESLGRAEAFITSAKETLAEVSAEVVIPPETKESLVLLGDYVGRRQR